MINNQNLRRIRLIVKGNINSLIFRFVHSKKFNSKDAIIICGAMRSGSTWLAELLSAVDNHIQIFEPLHPDYVKEVQKVGLGINRYFYLNQEDDNISVKTFLNQVLTGQRLNHWMLSQATIKEVLSAETLVVKFVRANLLIDWMTDNLDIRKPVVIIRHPCAVVTSILKKKWIQYKNHLLAHPYLEKFPHIKLKCNELNTQEELAALYWCLQYHCLLHESENKSFILVSYESLVRNGEDELMRIYSEWDEVPPNNAIKQLTQASDTATKDSVVKRGGDPLSGWKKYLTDDQVSKILTVLSHFDIHFYTTELEPNYELFKKYL